VATSETGLIGDEHLVGGIPLRGIPGVIVPFMTENQLLKKVVTIFSPPCSLSTPSAAAHSLHFMSIVQFHGIFTILLQILAIQVRPAGRGM
jgi:hypothetical protein